MTPRAEATSTPGMPETAPAASERKISLVDVSTHNQANDCWLAVDGGVYDVTEFVTKHPGGDKILNGCGKDATVMFASIKKHEPNAVALLPNFKIGTLAE